MNPREEWQHTQHSLRKLLHSFSEEDEFDRKVQFCFGLQYNPMFDFYHLWDSRVKMSLATIRVDNEQAVMRYFPEGILVPQLQKFTVDDKKVLLLPSQNVTRHDDWVQHHLQRRCERAVQEHLRFLERERLSNSPNILRISIPNMQMPSISLQGLSGTSVAETLSNGYHQVLVEFTDTPSNAEISEAENMVQRMMHHIGGFRPDTPVRFEELRDMYRSHRRRFERDQVEERAMREMEMAQVRRGFNRFVQEYTTTTAYNREVDEFYGRPVEQLQDYMMASNTVSEGQALTENDLMNAVQALDEAGVPRERSARWDRNAISRLVERISQDDGEEMPF